MTGEYELRAKDRKRTRMVQKNEEGHLQKKMDPEG